MNTFFTLVFLLLIALGTYGQDCSPPVAVCQDVTVQLDVTGNASIDATDVDGGSSVDPDCEPITRTIIGQTNFNCNDLGLFESFPGATKIVVLSVSDISGNTDTCHASVTVQDNLPPNPQCQSASVLLSTSGTVNISPGAIDAGSTDACFMGGRTVFPNSFDCDDAGLNFVTLSLNDLSGNTSTCTSEVYVIDQVPPNPQCQSTTVLLNASGSGSITVADIDAGSFDICGIAGTSVFPNTFDCDDIGLNSVTLTVTDVNDNNATCIAEVNVIDTVPPELICNDITIQLDSNGFGQVFAQEIATGSDACGTNLQLVLGQSTFTCEDVDQIFDLGVTNTDPAGNVSSCSVEITVSDSIHPCCAAPIAYCDTLFSLNLDSSGQAILVPDNVDAGSIAGCGLQSRTVSPNSFDCSETGPNTVILTVTDLNGSQGICNTVVMVKDITPPELAVPRDTTLDCTSLMLSNPSIYSIGVEDRLTIFSPPSIAGKYATTHAFFGPELTETPLIGNVALAEDQDSTNNINDLCGLLTPVSAFEVNGKIALIDAGSCSFQDKVFRAQQAGAVAVIIANNQPGLLPGMGTGPMQGITIPAVMVTKATGDTIKSELENGPVNVTLQNIPIASASDYCDPDVTISIEDDTISFDCAGISIIHRTCMATDASGNQTSGIQVITVQDTTPPLIFELPGSIEVCAGDPVSFTPPVAFDFCDTTIEVFSVRSDGEPMGADYLVGTTTVTCVATDACNNSISDSFNVTVFSAVSVDLGPFCKAVYPAYPDSACVDLAPIVTGGTAPYSFEWTSNIDTSFLESSPDIIVCPLVNTTYTIVVIDSNGCSAFANVEVQSIDISCKTSKVNICHISSNKTLCVPVGPAGNHLEHGDRLGPCGLSPCVVNSALPASGNPESTITRDFTGSEEEFALYPNPADEEIILHFKTVESDNLNLVIYSASGETIHVENYNNARGLNSLTLMIGDLKDGLYFIHLQGKNVRYQDKFVKTSQ